MDTQRNIDTEIYKYTPCIMIRVKMDTKWSHKERKRKRKRADGFSSLLVALCWWFTWTTVAVLSIIIHVKWSFAAAFTDFSAWSDTSQQANGLDIKVKWKVVEATLTRRIKWNLKLNRVRNERGKIETWWWWWWWWWWCCWRREGRESFGKQIESSCSSIECASYSHPCINKVKQVKQFDLLIASLICWPVVHLCPHSFMSIKCPCESPGRVGRTIDWTLLPETGIGGASSPASALSFSFVLFSLSLSFSPNSSQNSSVQRRMFDLLSARTAFNLSSPSFVFRLSAPTTSQVTSCCEFSLLRTSFSSSHHK